MRALLLTILLTALPAAALPAAAQTPDGSCAAAEAYLDAGDVRARLLNNGVLFLGGSRPYYEVPKGDGVSAALVASLWIGGLVRDSLHLSATTYGRHFFRAGPLGADGRPPAECAPFNRIYELRRDDLQRLAHTGEVTPNVRDWPAHLGAPVLDGDGLPATYDPARGDRPALYGDQTLWWVMNDVAAARTDETRDPPWRFEAPPVGVEVRVAAFAYDVAGAIGATTFYRLGITYRGAARLDSAYVGFYIDNDLGRPWDDYSGADTTLDLAYTYNARNTDGAYGTAPPALGYALLRTPAGDDGAPLGMTSFVPIQMFGGRYGTPYEPQHFYNILRGRWRQGERIVVGGDGTPGAPLIPSPRPTRFGFTGDPVTRSFWSMMNVDGAGTPHRGGDDVFSFASGPFTMEPGETEELWLAVAWSRGADHLDSVRRLKQDVGSVRDLAGELFAPSQATAGPTPPLFLASPFPNPTADGAFVRYRLPQPMRIRLSLYDALGREVAVVREGAHAAGDHAARVDVRRLAPGIYLLRLAHRGGTFTHPVVVVR